MKINVDLSMTELTTTLDSFKSETQRAAQLSVENTELRNKTFELSARLLTAEQGKRSAEQTNTYLRSDLDYSREEARRWENKYYELENELKKLRPNKDREALEKHPSYNMVLAHMARGDKIGAIKLTREILHTGLKEAKDLVESLPTAVLNDY